MAAMRWNGGLGAALGWNDPFPRCFLSRCSGPFGCHSVLSVLRLVSSWAGPQLPALCDPPRVPRALLSTASLTAALSASGPAVSVRLWPSRHRAAMRCRAGLGAAFGQDESVTRGPLAGCSGPVGLASVPSVLRLTGSLGELRLHFLCNLPRVPHPLLSTASLTID